MQYTNSKSILAKLLAKENLSIEHGNYDTAFFDLENRVLALPLWKEVDKDVYDLLIGHEVGHALETPLQGWHDSKEEIPKCSRAFINIIEDIRIEKLIQRRYPGLVASFKRGYQSLLNRDFFRIGDNDVNTMSFMNRVNLKSKLRDLIDVDFSAEEMPYFEQAMAVETWDDVINACKAIYDYLKEKQENEKQKQKEEQQQTDSGRTNSASNEQSSDETSNDSQEEMENVGNESDQLDDEQDSNDSAETDDVENGSPNQEVEEGDEEDEELEFGGGSQSMSNEPEVDHFDTSTDDAYRENERSLIEQNDDGMQPFVLKGLSRKQISEVLYTYEEIAASREKRIASERWRSDGEYFQEFEDKLNISYTEFLEETGKLVNVMVKEFETRKAAFQYSRAKTARSGTLNVNKLHEYKFNDDIFRKITKLADAKSHGMIMLIDNSGSMQTSMPDVIRQTLTLAMFCKKVNIPFEVYGFTSYANIKTSRATAGYNSMDHLDVILKNVLSSSLSKRDYETAFRTLFYQSISPYVYSGECEHLGGTPTVEVLSAMPKIASDFKQKHGIQKVIMPIITDGMPSPVNVFREYGDSSFSSYVNGNEFYLNIDGVYLKARNVSKMAEKLCDHLRSLGITTIGYFLGNSAHETKRRIGYAHGSWSEKTFKDAAKQQRTQKFVSVDNTLGYDRYFIIRVDNNSLSTQVDDFEVKEGARASEIARAFKKHSNAKKANRVFANQFAEIIS